MYHSCLFPRRTYKSAETQLGLLNRTGTPCPLPSVDSTVVVRPTSGNTNLFDLLDRCRIVFGSLAVELALLRLGCPIQFDS